MPVLFFGPQLTATLSGRSLTVTRNLAFTWEFHGSNLVRKQNTSIAADDMTLSRDSTRFKQYLRLESSGFEFEACRKSLHVRMFKHTRMYVYIYIHVYIYISEEVH
jgi:hypothetical protein